jgi:hypothetical protein
MLRAQAKDGQIAPKSLACARTGRWPTAPLNASCSPCTQTECAQTLDGPSVESPVAQRGRAALASRGATFGDSDGVVKKRGAGPGCTTPSTSTKLPRARCCARAGAAEKLRTGATQASLPSKIAPHASRLRVANADLKATRRRGQPLRTCWAGSPASAGCRLRRARTAKARPTTWRCSATTWWRCSRASRPMD